MTSTILKTQDGRLDAEDQAGLDVMTAKVRAGAPLHLHLHGGLVDEESGRAIATRLSGNRPDGLELSVEWEQAYLVWRTGAFETLRTNWTDLFENDRLYKTLLRKILSFASGKLDLPIPDGRAGFAGGRLSEAEVANRLNARASDDPFADLGSDLSVARASGRGVRPDALDEDQARFDAEFEYENDPVLIEIADDLAAALVFEPSFGRSLSVSGDPAEGLRMIAHLDDGVRAELAAEAPALTDRSIARSFTGLNLLAKIIKHLGRIVFRVIKRFRRRRDHGFYATVVEELARELYGDLIGAAIWGMMKRDAADHFEPGRLGSTLLDLIEEASSVTITAHSAGAIWAAELIRRLPSDESPKVSLVLLAPAVRTDLFAEALTHGGNRIDRLRMFTMADDWERKDAVLGKKWAYIYPSSLLYLVSGLFEELDGEAYPDAPLAGLQRFHGTDIDWIDDDAQIRALRAVMARFHATPDQIVYAKAEGGDGLNSAALSHGAFDQDHATLESVRFFLTA